MQYLYKILAPLTLVLFLVIPSEKAIAQYPGMDAVRAKMSRDFANQQMQTQMQTQMNMLFNNNWRANVGKGTVYQVTLKDSSVLNVKSFQYTDTTSHKTFLVYENKNFKKSDSAHRYQKIYADQTLYISVTDDDFGRLSYGVPLDSCWMFKVMNGPISVYAKSFYYLTLAANGNEQEFDKGEIVGIQLNDGPIVQLTDDNLKGMLGQDAAALESLEKKKYYKAIKKYNRHTKTDKKADPVSGE